MNRFQMTPYNPRIHYLPVAAWVQQRVKTTQGLDGFMLDRWETQFSPERLNNKPNNCMVVFENSEIVGVIAVEGEQDYHLLSMAPANDVFKAMLNWLTTKHKKPFGIWVPSANTVELKILKQLGLQPSENRCCNRRLKLSSNLQPVPLANEYQLIDVDINDREQAEQQALIDQDCFPWAQSNADFVQDHLHMPSYPKAIHKGVVNTQGTLVAFSVLWHDELNNIGVFEPVATHSEHRQKGIAKAMMTTMIRQAYERGCRVFSVGSYSPQAHATYESVGFTDYTYSEQWHFKS